MLSASSYMGKRVTSALRFHPPFHSKLAADTHRPFAVTYFVPHAVYTADNDFPPQRYLGKLAETFLTAGSSINHREESEIRENRIRDTNRKLSTSALFLYQARLHRCHFRPVAESRTRLVGRTLQDVILSAVPISIPDFSLTVDTFE